MWSVLLTIFLILGGNPLNGIPFSEESLINEVPTDFSEIFFLENDPLNSYTVNSEHFRKLLFREKRMEKRSSGVCQTFLDFDPLEVRDRINASCMSIEAEIPEVFQVVSEIIKQTKLRVYTPFKKESDALIFFIHGGAWVAGNLETHDNLARYLCSKVGVKVASVDYLNAPEGKFPFQLEQCYSVLQKIAPQYKQIAVIGDSAGGNMGAALCMMARDRLGPSIQCQVLINPAPDLSCEGTIDPKGDALDFQRWQARMYLNDSSEIYHPYVSPTHAKDLTSLPSTLILLAEHDLLYNDGRIFSDRLKQADVPVSIYCQMGIGHLAGNGARASETARESLNVAVDYLRDQFIK